LPQSTTDRSVCESEVRGALGLAFTCSDVEEELVAALVDCCEDDGDTDATAAAHSNRRQLRVGRWVILDGDLDLFKIVRDAVLSLAPAHYMLTSLTQAGIASLVFSVVQAARNAFKSGAMLSVGQVQLLVALKAINQPASPTGISSVLNSAGGAEWSPSRVQSELGTLSAFPTRGGVAAFVKANGNGEWIPNGF
jgi:hypothetical protein